MKTIHKNIIVILLIGLMLFLAGVQVNNIYNAMEKAQTTTGTCGAQKNEETFSEILTPERDK